MTIRKIAAAIALAGFFMAAQSTISPTAHAASETGTAAATPPVTVTVEPGHTLSAIATTHQTTYVRLYDANLNIEHPDIIHPGEAVRVPAPEEALASRPLPADAAPAATASRAAPKAAVNPAPKRAVAAPADVSVDGGVWDRLAQCEASGNWAINTGNGYYGGLQFTLSSWTGVGGTGYPHEASKATQIAMAERLLAKQGWGAWPACARKLGLL